MIKLRRGWPLGAATPSGGGGGKRPSPDDVQRLLAEWSRQIQNERMAVRQRRVLNAASPVHPASLDEVKVVSRIGGLRVRKNSDRKK